MATQRREKPEMIDGAVPIRYVASATPPTAAESVPVRGSTTMPIGFMIRPADTTPYAAGDAVTTSTSAPAGLTVTNCARFDAGGGVLLGGTLTKTTVSTTNAAFRVWLFAATDVAIPNDNAPWSPPVWAEADTLIATATVDFASGIVGTGGIRAKIVLDQTPQGFKLLAGTSILAIIEARAAYTPGSAEQFGLMLNIVQD